MITRPQEEGLRDLPVAVLGDGIIGLNTARAAARAGARVTVYSASDGDSMVPGAASDKSCALWYPVLMEGAPERVDRWCQVSYDGYERMFAAGYPGIDRVRNFEIVNDEESFRAVPQAIRRLPGFEMSANGVQAIAQPACGVWSFETFVISMPIHLADLRHRSRQEGCGFVQKVFGNLEELWRSVPEQVVFNCLGLGSRTLFGDTQLEKKKGHLLFFDPVDLRVSVGRYDIALIPRSDALVCGTLFLDECEHLEVTPDDRSRILTEVQSWIASDLFNVGLAKLRIEEATIRAETTGIRPLRRGGVRLETETVEGRLVVHDYGHGGSGVTVAPGCAAEAVALAASSLLSVVD